MFLAGSYFEIWGFLFYSVNIVKVTGQIQEMWLSHLDHLTLYLGKNWVSLSSLGHRGSEKPNFKHLKITGYLPVITGYRFFMGYPYL